MGRETESTDFLSGELNNVIDFTQLQVRTGIAPAIEAISEREFETHTKQGKLEYEKFMQEPVVIKIHKTTDKNEPPTVGLGCNGMQIYVPRERPVRLPRFFVENLARSQERIYRTERNPDPNADEGMFTKRHSGASFPFSVLKDDNPKGRAWLARVTHESA